MLFCFKTGTLPCHDAFESRDGAGAYHSVSMGYLPLGLHCL